RRPCWAGRLAHWPREWPGLPVPGRGKKCPSTPPRSPRSVDFACLAPIAFFQGTRRIGRRRRRKVSAIVTPETESGVAGLPPCGPLSSFVFVAEGNRRRHRFCCQDSHAEPTDLNIMGDSFSALPRGLIVSAVLIFLSLQSRQTRADDDDQAFDLR